MLTKYRSRCVLLAVPVLLLLAFATPAQAQGSPSRPWSHLWAWLAALGFAVDDGPVIDPDGRHGISGALVDDGPVIDPLGRHGVSGASADEGPVIDPDGRHGVSGASVDEGPVIDPLGGNR